MTINKLLTLLLLLCCSVAMSSQSVITGIVQDAESEEPLIGASVMIKGGTIGGVTDLDGKFSIEVQDVQKTVLTFSYVGYEKQDVVLKGRTSLVVELNTVMLEEIVVVGYGEVRKSDLTGAVSTVRESNIEELSVNTADQFLQGRAAGVWVSSNSAQPGGTSSIRIRGTNSLSANNEPLYVIDGIIIEYDGGTTNGGDIYDGTSSPSNPLAGLNPADIESVEILKDASATAIYGSRGANGVVIITTKRGERGKPQINFSSTVELSQARKIIDMLDATQYIQYRNEVRVNDGGTPAYLAADTVLQAGGDLSQYVTSHNWQEELFRTAMSGRYRLSFGGGDDRATYFIAAGWQDLEGIVDESGWRKGDIRLNYNVNLTDKFSIETNLSFARALSAQTATNGSAAGIRSAMRSILSYKPFIPQESTFSDDAEDIEDIFTPEAWVYDYTDKAVENIVLSKIAFQYNFSNAIKLRVRTGINYRDIEQNRYFPRTTRQGQAANGKALLSTFTSTSYLVEPLVFFNHKFNKQNRINGTVGASYNRRDNSRFNLVATNFPDDILRNENLALAQNILPPTTERTFEATLSYLARVNYTWKNKVLLTATGRYDGSSKFAEGNKYSFFPSFAVAYRLTQEKFFKEFDNLSNIKLRASWGQTGSQAIRPYQTLGIYGTNVQYPFGGNLQSGVRLTNIANPDLVWETTNQVNVGVDVGFFNERLSFNLDVYQKNTKDLLQLFPVPTSSGFDAAWRNFGSLENRGFELSANTVIVDKNDVRWDLGGNFAINRNEITSLGLPMSDYGYEQYWGANIHADNGLQQPANTFIVGQPVGLFWGYLTDGIYQNDEEITAGAEPEKIPGDIRYVDFNNDGVINALDKTIIGNPNPDFIWGVTTALSFKGLELSMLWNGVQGRDVLNANLNSEEELRGSSLNIRTEAWEGRWQGEGTSDYYPRAHSYLFYGQVNDRLIEDASYIRLRNATLSYSLPARTIRNVNNLRVFVSGVNLITITKYRGYDPEVDSFINDSTRIAIDNNSYPALRSVTFGLNVGF